jgi:hypothetical protein
MTSYQQRPGFGPGWFPDPMGRNDYRWWDGQTWSAAVVRGGAQGYDPLPTGPGGGRSGRRSRLVPVALVVVVALVAAAVVVVTRDDGDDDTAGGTSGGNTTASAGSVTEDDLDAILAAELDGDIAAIDVPGDPSDPLPVSLELEENDLGLTRVDLYTSDGIPDRVEIERESGPPVTVAVDADGRLVVDDPQYAEFTVDFDGDTAYVSWITVDGEIGTTTLDLPADAQEQLEDDLRAVQADKADKQSRAPSAAGPIVTDQQQGTPHQFRLSGHTVGFGQVTPSEVEVRIVPDEAYCSNVPLAGSVEVDVTAASCRGSWTAPHMHMYFDAVVHTSRVNGSALSSEESERLVAECATRLNGWAPTVGYGATALGILSTLFTLARASNPFTLIAGVAISATLGDQLNRWLTPAGIPEQCARELRAHLLDTQARTFLENAEVTVPYHVSIVDPIEDGEWDVATTSGPIVARPWQRVSSDPRSPWPGAVGSGVFDITLGGALNLSTGDVQVTATWQGDTDIDVHVIDPSGEEIFYSHPGSESGGALDHDAIPGCGATAENAEHVVWAQGTAPRGQYQVFVDNYSSCTGSSQLVHLEVIVYGDRRISENLGPGPDQQSSTMTFSVP